MVATFVLAVSSFALVTFVVGAAFLVFAVGVVAYAVRERRWVEAMAHRGVEVEARVERLKAHTAAGTDVRDGPGRWRYRAVVSFRDASEHEWMATTRWPATVGDRVAVRYDPDRPKRVVVADGPGSAVPPTWGYVALAGIAVIFGWIAISVGRTVG